MNPVTRPMTVLVSPNTAFFEPSSAKKTRSDPGQGDWWEMPKPVPGTDPLDPFTEGLRGLQAQQSDMLQMGRPLFSDNQRLGPKGSKTILSIKLEVFSSEAHRTLAQMSGPVIRAFYANVSEGGLPEFAQVTGIDSDMLDHFRENFSYLREMEVSGHLNRPELLLVAARFLGHSSTQVPPYSDLQQLADRRLSVLSCVWKQIKNEKSSGLTAPQQQLLSLCKLVEEIRHALADGGVQVLLAPPTSLTQYAKGVGKQLLQEARAKAWNLSVDAALCWTQMGTSTPQSEP